MNKTLIQLDQAGAEAKIVAYLCEPGNYRQLFLNNIKPHTFVAVHLVPEYWQKTTGIEILPFLNSPIPKLKSIPGWKELEQAIKKSDDNPNPQFRYYYIAKTVCHESNYDASANMIQLTTILKSDGALRLDLAECRKFRATYFKLFPEILRWHMSVQHDLQTRKLKNLFGFPREFNDFWGDSLFKKAYAFIPQSTVGTITNLAITELQQRIDDRDPLFKDVDLLQNGHDSILMQAPDELVLEVAREAKKHLERDLVSPKNEVFKMGAEVQIGKNWGVKSEKNPLGLEEIKL